MIRKLISLAIGVAFFVIAGTIGLYWFFFRVYVPQDMCMVLKHNFGEALPAGVLVAPDASYRGIIEEPLGPGRYFFNPIAWETKVIPLTKISPGDPTTWEWVHSLSAAQRELIRAGKFKFKGEFPMVGVVVRKFGKAPPDGGEFVSRDSEYRGTLLEVLTPGTYKINTNLYDIREEPATVIPAGFVGVVTNQIDVNGLEEDDGQSDALKGQLAGRVLSGAGLRGTVEDVLQPGVYFINPLVQKVILMEIGFNEYSQVKVSDLENNRISFPSDTGYDIRIGVTIVWGIDPKHAAQIINEFGNIDRVLSTVIGSQLPSICRNIGSTYDARDFIHGEKREMFQRDLTEELQKVCRAKNVEVLLALVREIEVHAPASTGTGEEVTEDLKRTIQQSYIAIEKRLTKQKQRDAAVVRAELEEARKKVDIARETIQADTRVMVANVLAEAEKEAAQIDAQADLEVATIEEQIATLDAKRIEILGQANADVEKFKKQAEAEGYKLLVDAFGGGRAFNLYTFADKFEPQSIRLFYAGEGTFWTDLDRFEELGAAKVLQPEERAASSK